jgi:internalin A
LDAIYAVFNREKCYRELKRLRGRFTRTLLELLVWGEHSVKEQRLFLGMMRSCGISFPLSENPWSTDDDDTEYIAPDLLPERDEARVQAELGGRWNPEMPTETVAFDYDMLHPGLVRGIICGIGGEAGVDALYWRGGVCVYETRTRSHALIEQQMTDAWHGRIHIQTQGGQASVLRDQLAEWIERRNNSDGLRATRIGPTAAPRTRDFETGNVETIEPGGADKPPGHFGLVATVATEYFVSYAWDDDEPGGQKREAEVDQLCARAEAKGIIVLRDKSTLRNGDSIKMFMRRMGLAHRIFVVLSDKYLRSAWCMTELLEIWQHSRGDDADFIRRIRVYCLPDARISRLRDRVELAAWWKEEFDRIDALNKQHGISILGTEGLQELYAMMRFYQHVTDILGLIATTVRPRTFEDLLRYGFDDPPDPQQGPG